MLVFSGTAAPRLNEIFESELGDLPKPPVKLLQPLQDSKPRLHAAA